MKQFSIDIPRFLCYNHNDMKYKNLTSPKKLILILLALALSLLLCACGDSEESESASESVAEETSEIGYLTRERALELIAKDTEIIKMFLCGSLCENKETALPQRVSQGSEYAEFSAVEALLASTYYQGGGAAEYFLSYPELGEKAVQNNNGETYVAYHKGSEYSDFAMPSVVELQPIDDSSCRLKVQLLSGESVELKALLSNGAWVLENSLCRVIAEKENGKPQRFSHSLMGSLTDMGGDILVIEFFYSDNYSKITEKEESDFHYKVSNAVSYVVNAAADYGRETFVTYERAYFEHRGILGNHELSFDLMFAETGFGTLQQFAEKNYDLSLYNGYMFFVCMNRDTETTFNVYTSNQVANEDPELYFAERIFVGNKSSSEDLARAFMCLLGATDFCAEGSDKYLSELYLSYFPNDPFCNGGLNGAEMSPVAAYACGMTDKLDPMLEIFIQ